MSMTALARPIVNRSGRSERCRWTQVSYESDLALDDTWFAASSDVVYLRRDGLNAKTEALFRKIAGGLEADARRYAAVMPGQDLVCIQINRGWRRITLTFKEPMS